MKNNKSLYIILLIAFGFGLSIFVRYSMFIDRGFIGYYQNEDAPAHLAVTAKIIASRPLVDHSFLPIFTTSEKTRWINNLPTASVASASGDYFYTSFPPLSFALTGFLTIIEHRIASPQGLRLIALCLGCIAGFMVFKICNKLAFDLGSQQSKEIGLIAASFYLFAPESLHSFCISLWAHQYYEVLLLIYIWMIQNNRFKTSSILIALACLTEWSGYLISIGSFLFGAILIKKDRQRAIRFMASSMIGGVIGGITMIAWFGSQIDIGSYLQALAHRADERSIANSSLLYLLTQYPKSIGILILIPIMACWQFKKPISFENLVKLFPVYIVSFTLFENLLLAGHAGQYSYDRLKGVMLMTFAFAWLASSYSRFSVQRQLILIALSIIANISAYMLWRNPNRNWSSEEYKFVEKLGRIMGEELQRQPEALTAYDGTVRGQLVYYAGENVIENFTKKTISSGMNPNLRAYDRFGDTVEINLFKLVNVQGVACVRSMSNLTEITVPYNISSVREISPVVDSIDDIEPDEIKILRGIFASEGFSGNSIKFK